MALKLLLRECPGTLSVMNIPCDEVTCIASLAIAVEVAFVPSTTVTMTEVQSARYSPQIVVQQAAPDTLEGYVLSALTLRKKHR